MWLLPTWFVCRYSAVNLTLVRALYENCCLLLSLYTDLLQAEKCEPLTAFGDRAVLAAWRLSEKTSVRFSDPLALLSLQKLTGRKTPSYLLTSLQNLWITLSLPRCQILSYFSFHFSHWQVKGLATKRTELEVNLLQDLENRLFPGMYATCTFQPGNVTCLGSETFNGRCLTTVLFNINENMKH